MNYGDSEYVAGLHPFIDFVYEDKSSYPFATTRDYIDVDNDFKIGSSDGILLNWDFIFINTIEYSEVAELYRRNKQYCSFYKGSKEYNDFWIRETKRRREGLTLNCKLYHKDVNEYYDERTSEQRKQELLQPLRITGDHYNHLNYGRMLRTPTKEENIELLKIKSKKKKIQDFPQFWDGDYWNYKVDEFAVNNGYNLAKSKARRKGYSYKRASQAANTVNLNTDITIILGAFDIKFLTQKGATASMMKTNLDWYERHTYWRRGYVKESLDEIHLGYKESSGGNAILGWNSAALSVSLFNNPSAFIGKDAVEVDVEEAGKCPNLQEVLNVSESSTESGDERSGIMRIYGTGGAKGADWAAFSEAFYKPSANNMLPLENVYDNDSRESTCGFFHPQILNYNPHMDEHGNSYLIKSFHLDTQRKLEARKDKTESDYNIYCAQRANSPSEAFILGNTNIFSSAALTEHYKDLVSGRTRIFYRDGQVLKRNDKAIFLTNDELRSEGIKTHDYIINVPIRRDDDPKGCVRMFHTPFKLDGVVPANLYVVVIDPMGKDVEEKEITIKHSLVSIEVWMLPNSIANSTGDILCASYTGRPNTLKEGSDIAMYLTEIYNGSCLPETDRGTVVTDFKSAGKKSLLARDPMRIIKDETYHNIPFGVNIGGKSANSSKADDAIIGYKDFLYTKCSVTEDGEPIYVLHYIHDIAHIKELLRYNKKGNFDRISAGRLYPIFRRGYQYRKVKTKISVITSTTIGSLGLYNK